MNLCLDTNSNYGSNKSNGKETGKKHLSGMYYSLVPNKRVDPNTKPVEGNTFDDQISEFCKYIGSYFHCAVWRFRRKFFAPATMYIVGGSDDEPSHRAVFDI